MSASWAPAYVATSTLLGEPLETTLASIVPPNTSTSEAPNGVTLAPPVAALASQLRSGSREVRAQALARALSEVVLALDAVKLA